MLEAPSVGLRIVGPEELDEARRAGLRPGEPLDDSHGTPRTLPSHFYEIPSWEAAMETRLAPSFGLWELIDVDLRESETMRLYPRYVPCALVVLAAHLQLFRNEVGSPIRVAANGGYRSPAHAFSRVASPHSWGTAANVYRVGDEWLDTRERIQKYVEVARRTLPAAWVRPYGEKPGYAFDHLHIDLGYFAVEPHASGRGEAES